MISIRNYPEMSAVQVVCSKHGVVGTVEKYDKGRFALWEVDLELRKGCDQCNKKKARLPNLREQLKKKSHCVLRRRFNQ